MSKTLQNIIEKAVSKGFANKNARMWLGYGYGELESQWQARYNKVTVMHLFNYSAIVEDFTEIDRKHFKAFEPTSYEEAYKLPMIKVMKG